MTRWALFAVVGFLSLCLAATAAEAGLSEPLSFEGATLESSSVRLPAVSLEDEDQFFFSTAFGWTRPTANYLPPFSPGGARYSYRPTAGRRNPVEDIVDWQAPSRIQFGGEIGFFYGKSTGTYGAEDVAGYIIGTVGNEKFSITAGYSHRETTFEAPRRRR